MSPDTTAAVAPARIPCRHCHTLFDPGNADEEFCCGGCAFVYRLIHDSGFEDFYALKGARVTAPVKSTALYKRDDSWLRERVAAAESEARNGAARLELGVQGISCAGCVWLLERLFERTPGALRARVRAHPGRVRLEWEPGKADIAAYVDEARRFGYLIGPPGETAGAGNAQSGRLGLCGAFAMNAMAFTLPGYLGMKDDFALAPVFLLASAACATLAVLTGGSTFIVRAWRGLRAGAVHMDLPIAAGILAAYFGSMAGWLLGVKSLIYFDFVAVFTFLMLAGRRLQLAAVERNRGRLLGTAHLSSGVRTPEGAALALEELKAGVKYQVAPGQTIPVTSRLTDGGATVSLESINGESEARDIPAGGRVLSGSLYIGRVPLTLEAMETWEASLYRRLRGTGETEARHPLLERILRTYILVVILLATGGGLAWGVGTGDVATGLQVFISLLVVSCPCALGVAIPLADDLAAAALERVGVFVRRAVFWPRLLRVKHIILDKTGTLTLESPKLSNPAALDALTPEALAALRALTADSLHPVSRSLTEALAARPIPPGPDNAEVEEITGQGVRFIAKDGALWALGKPGWSGGESVDSDEEADGAADAVFSCDGVPLARFRFTDALRPDTAEQTARLQRQGFQLHILSGDRPRKTALLAEAAGIPASQARGGLSPLEKAEAVRRLDHRDTLYIGDGANDSLAFEEAFCTGTPVVDKGILESRADFYFLGRSLRFFTDLFSVARLRRRAVRRVVLFAIAYNAAAAGLCLAGMMNPLLAAVLMPLSSLVTLAIVTCHFKFNPRVSS